VQITEIIRVVLIWNPKASRPKPHVVMLQSAKHLQAGSVTVQVILRIFFCYRYWWW